VLRAATEPGDSRDCLKAFLDDPETRLVLISGDKDPLFISRPPAKLRKKLLYLVKKTATAINVESGPVESQVLVGELGEDPLGHLSALSEGVLLPLLSNPKNREGWPEVIAREVSESLHRFVASVYVTMGQTKGQTLLPLPSLAADDAAGPEANAAMDADGPEAAAEAHAAQTARDKDLVHVVESAVVTWTRQIKAVLTLEPESVFLSASEPHPGPTAELQFWKDRAADLNSIHAQITGPRVARVTRILELAKSTYHAAFERLLREVLLARAEANHVLRFLTPLEQAFDKLSLSDDFPELGALFRPLLHQVLLVWRHSRYYCTPQRLVVLMREVCNDLIAQAGRYVQADKLLSDEPADAVAQLKIVLRVLGGFKAVYFEYRQRSQVDCPDNPWRFQHAALFARLDTFLERAHDLLECGETVLQFLRLERVEIGGTHGRGLTATIKQIYAEFLLARERMQQAEYDPLDVDADGFAEDFLAFRATVRELERQLGSVVTQAFDDCNTVEYTFKLLDGFEGLLDRDIVRGDLMKKTSDLLASYRGDIAAVHTMFHRDKAHPPVARNGAPRSGAVAWVRSLRGRIEGPADRARGMADTGLEADQVAEIDAARSALVKSMSDFETQQIEAWYAECSRTSSGKLKLPLLQNDKENATLLRVNFDPALVRLLREVKYFKLLGVDVPDAAKKVYEKHETYRRQVGNLELVSGIYNDIELTLLDIERPLVVKSLETVRKSLDKALTVLNWNSHKIDDYLSEAMKQTRELADVLTVIKGNMTRSEEILAGWADRKLWSRKDKPLRLDDLAEHVSGHLEARYADIEKDAGELHALLSSSNRILKVSKGEPAWRAYVDYVGDFLLDGMARATVASLAHLHADLEGGSGGSANDKKTERESKGPFLEIELKLVEEVVTGGGGVTSVDLAFDPPVGLPGTPGADQSAPSIRKLFMSWIRRIVDFIELVKRLDVGEGSYAVELEDDHSIIDWVCRLKDASLAAEARLDAFRASYLRFEPLWALSPAAELSKFLEREAVRDEDGKRIADPPLERFEAEIVRYKAIQEDIASLSTSADLGWIRVACKHIKSQLASKCSQWVFRFTSYLQNRVTSEIEELHDFIRKTSATLDIPVGDEEGAEADDVPGSRAASPTRTHATDDGEDGAPSPSKTHADDADDEGEAGQGKLYRVMASIRDIKVRREATDTMFEPLGATVDLLKAHMAPGAEVVPESTTRLLEDGPAEWLKLKRKLEAKKESVALAQQLEGAKIRRASDDFIERVERFRRFFQENAPFKLPGAHGSDINGPLKIVHLEAAYHLLDQFRHGRVGEWESVSAQMAEYAELRESQELFDLFVVDPVHLRRCEDDLTHLKALWDMTSYVTHIFVDWRSTKWDAIDTDTLMETTKELRKELKTLSATARTYDVYRILEDSVNAMATSLPLVGELHDPAMRDRHWQALMTETKKEFVVDARFTLGTLLDLGLHHFEDQVADIVDRAKKEEGIEKQLNKIKDVWAGQQLEFVPYAEVADVFQVQASDELREILEADNLTLQVLASGKYVQGNPKFVEIVTLWQRQLGTVTSVLEVWLEVQNKWQNLESIFIGSQDIRVQLPEDSKRFDAINSDFKELAASAPDITNAVEACNLDGRLERLEHLFSELEICEKALQDYLETKRLIFPRFYFIAQSELLDLLSKGSQPLLIQKHLPKIFDNIARITYAEDEKGAPTKTGTHMTSKEGEVVAFCPEGTSGVQPCLCDGPVEIWMQTVIDSMRAALRYEFKTKAMPSYEEMKRSQWIREATGHTVQMTIIVSRVYFTSEINEAFGELEDGNEDALKVELQRQTDQLVDVIDTINLPDLSKKERKRLIMLCTIDVHARDVVSRLIEERVENGTCFQWLSQLRYFKHDKTGEVQVNIVDADAPYNYEYVGIPGCLCITPLTDRCYITLTQAQRLKLGGAPAGPAGTGKTETVKDLARHLATMIFVFNCSDQMDFRAMGAIYKGLAQTGAWGCFDEFNRIPVSVLSVCSTQYKTVLDALRASKKKFIFEEVEIRLEASVMAFITMNPGYPGRAELPESVKALFRPVSMVVPDLAAICEIMLMAEGFQGAKILSRKFVILYKLCEDLLSKSRHYDWKLRAIKTTLYVAGGMKRAAEKTEPDMTEEKVLLRALRDFNLGKLTADDQVIFMGLLNDLFPKKVDEVKRAVDHAFEPSIAKAAEDLSMQVETCPLFSLKISQLREIFEVRWSVFLLGPAGCGKSSIWRTLKRAQNLYGEKSDSRPINPKSVTRNELYGYLHPTTREWREGLISTTFRHMATEGERTHKHQWIVLDGDIDAEWIESMNTVMDDNKMLTLASGERITLSDSMRLLLEINHMVHCSPATVSRGGVIYVNQDDIGWVPAKDSWIESLECETLRPLLIGLFDKYVDESLEYVRRNLRTLVPLQPIAIMQSVFKILEGLLPREKTPPPDDAAKKLLEANFVFALVWSLGGCLLVDKVTDHRTDFSRWWVSTHKTVQFPLGEGGSLVFDFYVDQANGVMRPWADQIEPYSVEPGAAFSSIFVPTVDTQRMSYFLDRHVELGHYVMFVGNAGTGKTAIMNNYLHHMDKEKMMSSTVNMNSFTLAPDLQITMEQPLQKSNVRWGPPGTLKMVYFIDDMNMPFKDKYDTQSAVELVRQYVDYQGWYDKGKIQQRKISNCLLSACMNPTSGSFNITPRMQRHFTTLAVQMPPPDMVRSIFACIIEGHFGGDGFSPEVASLGPKLVDATIELHKEVMNNFMPSAVKFHYQWNLRELSNIAQGLTRADPQRGFDVPAVCARLFVHEVERVFLDRMVSNADADRFEEIRKRVTKKYFADLDMAVIEERPNVFCSFIQGQSEDSIPYLSVPSYDKLSTVLMNALKEYNESNATMDLVLFQQAMEHVCRISRILDQPGGHPMLVGVGGSGRQSLGRLAAFVSGGSGMEVFQIQVTATYGIDSLKEDILKCYTRAGTKGVGVVFMLTDNQIVDERFLVYINDLLADGFIPDVVPTEEKDNFINAVRSEAKAAGVLETNELLWDFFIAKVRRLMHVCLCFSPTGDRFRVRARQFPGLVNCCVFDWFHPWPQEALVAVAQRFLADIENVDEGVRDNLAHHMAFAHTSVTEASLTFQATYRRWNYVTPKSYLELIALYKSLLASKRESVKSGRERLENGLDKIAQAAAQVADLQIMLEQEKIVVEEKQVKTKELIEVIGRQKADVEAVVEASREDEEKAQAIAEAVTEQQAVCEAELAAAEPLIAEAIKALAGLEVPHLVELKSLKTPSDAVGKVAYAVMTLFADAKKPLKDKDLTWQNAQKFMGNAQQFKASLEDFGANIGDHLDKENNVATVEKKYKDAMCIPGTEEPAIEDLKKKSVAAAGLAGWVVNICKYFRVFQKVKPLREDLAAANEKLEKANAKLSTVRAKVASLNAKVAALEEQFAAATEEKNKAIAAAEKTQNKADLADRLITGLASERQRWGETVKSFLAQEGRLVGDVLVASSFVAYAGPFNMQMRKGLVNDQWLPDLVKREVPMTEGVVPMDVLASDTLLAKWSSEGLPTDPLSQENGAIMNNSSRWPLLVDPQLQGITWITNREKDAGLKVIQLSQAKYIDTVKACIEGGLPLIIEKLDEDIDAVLEPVVARSIIKKGRNQILRLGDDEVDYNPSFRLFLQTKLGNPHYKPEIAAQTTIINFCVTEKGLEDQLLAQVVGYERPDMQKQSNDLIESLNGYAIQLEELEDSLLARLAAVQGDILEDVALVENLELTKVTATEIAESVAKAKVTSAEISLAREVYRPVAARGSLVYFLIDNLSALDRVYHYSMANFVRVLTKGMDLTPQPDEHPNEKQRTEQRVAGLVETVSRVVFQYVAQGLFERHKLIVATQLAIAILRGRGQLDLEKFDYLLRGPKVEGADNPCSEFINESSWASVQALARIEDYQTLPDDLVSGQKRWKEWLELQYPEDEAPPGDWKRQPEFERLLLFRALRPDRLTAAMRTFVAKVIGEVYVVSQAFDLERSMEDASPMVPIFIFLSPGVDAAAAVETLGATRGMTADEGTYHTISLGQGQEEIANRAMRKAQKEGGWVLLQNVHLTIDWTSQDLVQTIDRLGPETHEDFRLFISAEPPPGLERPLPISIMQNSIKLTQEPPEGLKANLHRAWGNFSDEIIENCSKQAELRSLLFALCYFHAVILERKKFGVGNLPGSTSGIGWNMNYPFNTGDLLCCGQVAVNFLESSTTVPWDDLRYVVGEIMYGGHIVEDWDRRLSSQYLERYFNDELLEGMDFYPGFSGPPNTATHKEVTEYIEDNMKGESPVAFGLHPNAEIGFKLREAESFCASVLNLQPRTAGGDVGLSVEERAKNSLDELLERLPDTFDMEDIRARCDGDFSPYTMVAIQESERINVVIIEIKRSLIELDLGLKGDLTMTGQMELLMNALANDATPGSWAIIAYPSLRPLSSWFVNLLQRHEQLLAWTGDLSVPFSVWLSGLFNPQSFLTAVKQTTARRNDWPLDKTEVITEVTKKATREQVDAAARDGAFIHGLTLEGARWDDKAMALEDSLPKQLFCPLPVILVRAVQVDRSDIKDAYLCPVYTTEARFRQEVFTAQLRSKTGQLKWTLAGVAAFLDVVL